MKEKTPRASYELDPDEPTHRGFWFGVSPHTHRTGRCCRVNCVVDNQCFLR